VSYIDISHVSGPKATGKVETSNRFESSECLHRYPTFRMETAESIRASILQGDWTVSIDLSDTYFHVPIHGKFKLFLMLRHREQIWQFRALPFGLSTAPRIFTMVMAEVKRMAARRGIVIHIYLDD